jgi:Uma2 family endonuclease
MELTTLLTADDLLSVPDPDLPHELLRGVLRRVMPASGAHGLVVGRVLLALGVHVQAQDLGELFSEATGFLLARNPDTVLCPDVSFVVRERLAAAVLERPFPELAPDLAVEVLSPSDRAAAVRAKVGEYLAAGVRAVWVLDPATRTVRVHHRGGRELLLSEQDVLDGGNVVPGFRCSVAPLFAALPRSTRMSSSVI